MVTPINDWIWVIIYLYFYVVFFYLVDLFVVGEYLEEYMVLNMKKGNGKAGRIEN